MEGAKDTVKDSSPTKKRALPPRGKKPVANSVNKPAQKPRTPATAMKNNNNKKGPQKKPPPKKDKTALEVKKDSESKTVGSDGSDLSKPAHKKSDGDRKCPVKTENGDPIGDDKRKDSKVISDKLPELPKVSSALTAKKVNQNSPAKKVNQNSLPIGEKKLTSNFGALMASFFSRQRVDGGDESSTTDKTSKDTGTPPDIKKEVLSKDSEEASAVSTGQQKKEPGPGKQNKKSPVKDEEDKGKIENGNKKSSMTKEQSPKKPAIKDTPDNKKAPEDTPEDKKAPVMKGVKEEGKPEDKKAPVMKGVKEEGKPVEKKDPSNDDGNANFEQMRMSSSIGALLAGFGNRQRPAAGASQPFSSPGASQPFSSPGASKPFSSPGNKRKSESKDLSLVKPEDSGSKDRPVEKKTRGPEEKAEIDSSKDTKAKKEPSNEDEDEMEQRRIRGVGALLAGLGGRQRQVAESPKRFSSPGNKKNSETKEPSPAKMDDSKNEDKPIEKKTRGPEDKKPEIDSTKDGKIKKESSIEDDNSDEIGQRMVSSSIGALLAGLGNRQRQVNESPQPISSPGNRRKSVNKEPSFVKPEDSGHKDEQLKRESRGPEEIGDSSKDRKMKKDSPNEDDNSEEIGQRKMSSSIGALLAGLGNRHRQAAESPQPFSPAGNRKSVTEEPPFAKPEDRGNEDRPVEEKARLAEEDKCESSKGGKIKKDLPPEDDNSEEIGQRKVSSSIGALLAGLGNRQHRAAEASQPFSSPDDRRKSINKEPSFTKQDNIGSDNRPVEEKTRGLEESEDVSSSDAKPTSVEDGQQGNGDDWSGNSSFEGKQKWQKKSDGRQEDPNDDRCTEAIVQAKKQHSLGSLLAGLGARRQEFQQDDDQNQWSSPRGGFRDQGHERFNSRGGRGQRGGERGQRGGGRGQRSEGYGDFGFVRDKFPNNKRNKRSLEEFAEEVGQSTNFYEPPPLVKEEDGVLFVRGHKPKPKLTEKELEDQKKSLSRNNTFEEEAEKRKVTGIGALLTGLANQTIKLPPPPEPVEDEGDYYGRRGRGDGNRRGGFRKRGYEEGSDDDEDGYRGNKRFRDRDRRDKEPRDRRDKEPFDTKKATEEVKRETERLEKEHGPGVFSVGFTENRLLAFVCEICNVQLNKQTVEAHTDGMQHLKKKNVWEKKKYRQQLLSKDEDKQKYAGGRVGWVKVDADNDKSGSSTPRSTPASTPAPVTTPVTDNGAGESAYGYNGGYGQDGYGYDNQYYMQPPSYGQGYMEMGPMGGYMMAPPIPDNKSTAAWGNSQYGAGQFNTQAKAVTSQMNTNSQMNTTSQMNTSTQINTSAPPPPPPVVEAPPKPKPAKGGATVSLLQRLDACAVKNEKDLDLAASVISALLKSLKEFNHKRGDTKVIEVLTEIDIKFRGLKPKVSAYDKISKAATPAPSNSNPYKSIVQSAYATHGSSDTSKYDASKDSLNKTGTWYSQGRGNNSSSAYTHGSVKLTAALEAVASNYSSKSSGGYASAAVNSTPTMSSGYSHTASKPPASTTASRYAADTTSAAPAYATHSNYYSTSYPIPTAAVGKPTDKHYQSQAKSTKDAGYHTQQPAASTQGGEYQGYSSKTGGDKVMEIIRLGNEPPPPPPPESNAAQKYAAQGYQTNTPVGYYDLSGPPPQYNPLQPQYNPQQY